MLFKATVYPFSKSIYYKLYAVKKIFSQFQFIIKSIHYFFYQILLDTSHQHILIAMDKFNSKDLS